MQEMDFFTRVEVPTVPFGIDFATGIVSLGSCFSDEIGRRLQDGGFHIEQNPFGTLYNPASIASALRRMIHDRGIGEEDLVEYEGWWHSWHHHGSFSRATKEECMEACNSRLHQAHQALKEARLLMITFGSAWVYGLADSGETVANCHKLPQERFERRMLTVDDIVALWRPLLEELRTCNPGLHVLFTVSPIRHVGDGIHGNQLSKSTLLLAVDALVDKELLLANRKRTGVKAAEPEKGVTVYFPAYEIVLDELRDYRFYGPDMVHPTDLSVDVVWDRFQHATMVPAVRDQAHLNAKQAKRVRHVPMRKGKSEA